MGIYGKIKKSAASVASKVSQRSPVTQDPEESVSASSYAPPTNVEVADADASYSPPTNVEVDGAVVDADPNSTIPPDAAAVSAAASVAASLAASEKTSPPPVNIAVPGAGASGIESIIGSNSDGSDDSKKKALLSGEDQDPEMGADEIIENKSIISKASSYIKSQLSMNNSTIATNTLGMSGDAESMNSSPKQPKNLEKKSMKEMIMDRLQMITERLTICYATLLAFWYSLSKIAQVSLLTGAALGSVGVVALIAFGGRAPAFPAHINVAFVGNSYFYVNDLPRFVQNIAGGHISQNSCLHNSANILHVIMTGNGMWKKWATKKAMIDGVKFETSSGNTAYLYDMGACSVPQLLTGHDEMLSEHNVLGTFVDDGQNPCFQEDAYLEYQESVGLKVKGGWDFLVITDQSKAMVADETRQQALAAFNYTYGPILKKKNISPIIVQPHAYFSDGANSTSLSDISTFTALIMEGAKIYKNYLGRRTGWFSHAHIAPVGNAFVSVYEESQFDLYPKLFMDDGIHPSAYGTFLYGCVIYATMTGYMPKYNRVVVDDMENSDLFDTARRLQASNSNTGFPTKDEAAILYKIAKKVALRGYKPRALRGFKIDEDAADFLNEDEDFNNDYEGDYNDGQQYYQDYVNYQGYYGGSYNNGNQQQYNGGYGNNNDAQQQYEQYYYNNNGGYGNNGYQQQNNQYYGGYGNNGYQQNNQYYGGYENNGYQQQNNQYNGGYGNDDAAQQQNANGQYQQYYYNGGYGNDNAAQQQNGNGQYYYNNGN